jgi:hypothetical protein
MKVYISACCLILLTAILLPAAQSSSIHTFVRFVLILQSCLRPIYRKDSDAKEANF